MDNHRLRYFVAAAEEANSREVPLGFGTNPSAISRHVSDIEEEQDADQYRLIGIVNVSDVQTGEWLF